MIREEIEKADLPNSKRNSMAQPYSSIAVHPELGKAVPAFPRGVLNQLITMLHNKVWRFVTVYHDFDVVGRFYGEFLKYTGGDKKALGIVLTPRHITELFALIANVKKDSRVLDICAGTGGFLISCMHQMLKQAVTEKERNHIKKHCLVGVEQQPNMYALAASNMILRGDGKANLYQGSCFDAAITRAIKAHHCNVGMINPPYSQEDESQQELKFVQHMLDCLEEGGTGIAIVPMSCAISAQPVRDELLSRHTLEAVMSMPDELFYPVGVITCIMVFTAHVPHATNKRKTWFGYWKVDGFFKTKHKGRIDGRGDWAAIRTRWVEQFRNREAHPGQSVTRHVTPEGEWCAEAYMETDYGALDSGDFEEVVKDYAIYRLMNEPHRRASPDAVPSSGWQKFRLGDLFDIKKGKRLTKAQMVHGETPFIGAIDNSNGVTAYIGQSAIHPGNTITVNYNGNGVAEAFYQPRPFWCSDDVNVLYPRFNLTPAIALFVATLIRLERYRFNYGRKWHLDRMRSAVIRLPTKTDGSPDWRAVENYIHRLPFGDQIDSQKASSPPGAVSVGRMRGAP